MADLDSLASNTLSRTVLTPEQLHQEVSALGLRWTVEGQDLKLQLAGPMARTGAVAAYAGSLADQLEHHPRIVLEYGTMVLTVHTHDQNAITVLDLVYAARLERWMRANGW